MKRKWRMLAKSLARIVLLLLLIMVPAGCYVMQPTGSSDPAKWNADPELLKQEVRALTEDFGPRYYNRPETMAKCRAYIRKKFEAHGAEVTGQQYLVHGKPQTNVRGLIGSENDPRIVVGAHYDACDGHSDGDHPGADDNASGVAGLFGLARLLQKQAPEGVAIELVAYSTEEPPFFGGPDMGSYHHAKLLKEEGVDVRAVIILEMIGYFSDEPGSQNYPLPLMGLAYPSKGNFIALTGGVPDRGLIRICKRAMKGSAPLPVYSTCVPRSLSTVHLSDHRNYWPFGFEAIMVTDTAFYRNPNYHLDTDTWESLDYERMAQAVTQVHQAVLAVAED